MDIFTFDHIELLVTNLNETIKFYTEIMGFQLYSYGPKNQKSLIFGNNKMNLLTQDELENSNIPKAKNVAISGSSNLCFITNKPLKEIMSFLKEKNVEIVSGPSRHTGATNLLISIYINDPDGNLIQIGNNVT